MAGSATDVAGKCLAIFFPIWTFVASGFEHCVANMYFLPAGYIAAKNPEYINKAVELYGVDADTILSTLSFKNMAWNNLIPVSIGNVVGGLFLIALVFYFVHKSKRLNNKEKQREKNKGN